MPRTPSTKTVAPAARKPRTRKVAAPAKPLCKFCEERPAEFGTVCDVCTEELNRHELQYLEALLGNQQARTALKKMTKAERTKIAPTYLAEDDLDAFINKGVITGRHQAALRQIRKLFGPKSNEKEIVMTSTTKTSTSTRKRPAGRKVQATPAVEAKVPASVKRSASTGEGKTVRRSAPVKAAPVASKTKAAPAEVTAAQVAAEAKIDGRKFRAFLRANDVPRTAKAMRAAVKKFNAQK